MRRSLIEDICNLIGKKILTKVLDLNIYIFKRKLLCAIFQIK